jgi:hypothetical protein
MAMRVGCTAFNVAWGALDTSARGTVESQDAAADCCNLTVDRFDDSAVVGTSREDLTILRPLWARKLMLCREAHAYEALPPAK